MSSRLLRLRGLGYADSRVADLFGSLAQCCLDNMRVEVADQIIEKAEHDGLQVRGVGGGGQIYRCVCVWGGGRSIEGRA